MYFHKISTLKTIIFKFGVVRELHHQNIYFQQGKLFCKPIKYPNYINNSTLVY
jgi:hypothetical protein